ncbi:MAG: hypothetical protein COX30_02035 [Candidatus Moranbacteria bacterium CG23_combo_of_CG06-09_8_20_14_all_39_10]|nr:MAG: hypothetical protein COX30_02035 [Candidatus Moranbacteria bacterium CG23_combo_of_CG06-09_8_20_14_all_39_10]
MNKKIKIEIAVGTIVLLALMSGLYIWKSSQEIKFASPVVEIGKKPEQKMCTQDAKLCADGTYVSRTGSNCEFAACPEVKNDVTADWQTYRNEEYGFEFQYPKNWSVTETKGINMPQKTSVAVTSNIDDKLGFGVLLFKSTDDLKTLYDHFFGCVECGRKAGYKIDTKQLTINGYPAYYVHSETVSPHVKFHYAISDNKGMILVANFYEKDNSYDSYLPDFNRFANSIKFTSK